LEHFCSRAIFVTGIIDRRGTEMRTFLLDGDFFMGNVDRRGAEMRIFLLDGDFPYDNC